MRMSSDGTFLSYGAAEFSSELTFSVTQWVTQQRTASVSWGFVDRKDVQWAHRVPRARWTCLAPSGWTIQALPKATIGCPAGSLSTTASRALMNHSSWTDSSSVKRGNWNYILTGHCVLLETKVSFPWGNTFVLDWAYTSFLSSSAQQDAATSEWLFMMGEFVRMVEREGGRGVQQFNWDCTVWSTLCSAPSGLEELRVQARR